MKKTEKALNNEQKSFKIFRLVDKKSENGLGYLPINVRPARYTGICFMPLCDNKEELANSVKAFFGYNGYYKYFSNYVYTLKFVYQPFFFNKVKVIRKIDKNEMENIVSLYLPKLRNSPTFLYKNNRNMILDYTEQFKEIFPVSENMLKMPVMKYSEYIFPEILIRFGVDVEKSDLFKWCAKYTSSNTNTFINMNHDTLIVPINIKSTNNQLITRFLNYNNPIPLSVKRNVEDMKLLSMIRFIFRAYCKDCEDIPEADPMRYFVDSLNNHRVIFFFHNKRFAFTIDFEDLRNKDVNSKKFNTLFRSKLIMLISNNLGVEADETLDVLIEEENKKDIEETNKLTIDANVSVDKDGIVNNKNTTEPEKENTVINDDVSNLMSTRISKIVTGASLKETDSASIIKNIRKKTDDLFEAMDKSKIDDYEDISEFKSDELVPDEDVETIPVIEDEYAEDEQENTGDIPEDLLSENTIDKDIRIDNGDELTEEEKIELLKEINKKQAPKKSEKQLRRIAQVRDMYKSISTEDNRTLEEIIKDTETLQIDASSKIDSDSILDKSVTECRLQDFEKSYIDKKMKQDIIKAFSSFSNGDKSIPLHIVDYEEKDTSDRFNNKTTITVKFEDEDQKQHTIKVDIPKPNKDGTLTINGSKKVLKKQIVLLPLVKISPEKLAINTWWNKVLMFRQGTVLNRTVVLIKKLAEVYLKEDPETFSIKYGKNTKSNKKYITTIEYDELTKNYHKFIIGKKGDRTAFFFNQDELREEIKKLDLIYNFNVNKLPLGIDYPTKTVIDFDMRETNSSVGKIILDVIYKKAPFNGMESVVSSIKPPKRRIYSKVTIQSFDVPTIIFLGSLYGIRNIMNVNNMKYTFSGKPIKGDTRLYIKFKDGYLYYPEYPFGNTLLFNGLCELNTEDYMFDDFETPLPYIDWAYKVYRKRNMYKGWVGFKEIFIDPETFEILKDLSLPTDFLELFLYANELLTDNNYTNETKVESYRIRGYEIIPHALYRAIGDQYLKYKQQENKARSSISIPQEIITTALSNSEILENYDSINPINELKMKCICSFKGKNVGGANVKHGFHMDRRAFGEDAMGLYAMSNVDNGTVGITKQLTSNPRIMNTRGYIDPADSKDKIKKITAGEKMSPDELIMPCAQKFDHPNRLAFSSGQWKHTLPIYGGGDPPMIGSGFEKTLIGTVGDTFSIRSDKDGVVVDINDETKSIIVEFKDGKREAYRYGKELIRNSNFFLENNLTLNVKVGQKIKANEVLAYSKEFFTPTTGGDLTFTMGVLAKVAIMDDYFTEEDSSLVSYQLSERMQTSVTKCKQISFSDKSNIVRYSKVGDHLNDGDPILIFEDVGDADQDDINQILEMMGDVDEEAMESIAYHSPKANATGEITKMEVYWTGEIENMSDSCKKLVNEYIKYKKAKIKFEEENTGNRSSTNCELEKSVPKFGMINGTKLEESDILIEYYITHVNMYGNGDKLSFAPAIKSVTPQVLAKDLTPYSESGPIDAVMGLLSLSNRQVNSPYFLGACGKILFDKSKSIAAKYLGKE